MNCRKMEAGPMSQPAVVERLRKFVCVQVYADRVPHIIDSAEAKRLLEAKLRAEEASKLVIEKNQMLESLSAKLSKYLSPQLFRSIFSGEKNVEVASQRKKLTIFFSDIKDFTATTERLQPEQITLLLNEYFTEMSRIALEHGATIDKFIGDAMLMFFGDPESKGVEEDAKACVRMAIAMHRFPDAD